MKASLESTWTIDVDVNGLDWQCCLAGISKTAPRIFIFSIVLGAEYLSYVKPIATYAPTFFGYIISVLAIVLHFLERYTLYVSETNKNRWNSGYEKVVNKGKRKF